MSYKQIGNGWWQCEEHGVQFIPGKDVCPKCPADKHVMMGKLSAVDRRKKPMRLTVHHMPHWQSLLRARKKLEKHAKKQVK